MRYPSTPMRSALAFAGALFGVPAAPKLVVRVGAPVPYRIALPAGAVIEAGPGLVSTRIGGLVIVAAATDMLEGEENPLPMAKAESRRILTNIIMGSDALLFALLDEEFRRRTLELGHVVRGIGTLGGQRAACVRGRFQERGVAGWLDIHATVKDGIMYMLAFTVSGADHRSHEPLIVRIRASFVLPR